MMTWYKMMIIVLILQLLFIPIIFNHFHPLNMMTLLIMFTTLMLMMNYLNSNISIYLYLIFISIIGGVMIMFLYFTSLINNYKMKMLNKEKILLITTIIFNIIILIMFYKMNPIEEELMIKSMNIFMIYIYPYNLMTYSSIIYLFYCLTMIMKMCSMKFKPLRKMKN